MRRASLACIYELAKQDERVLFLGSDLGAGVLDDMKQEMPDRWFMEGVAEQHIIGMAAGLRMYGYLNSDVLLQIQASIIDFSQDWTSIINSLIINS